VKWQTKITLLLGCRYPVLQGAVAGIGTWPLAAAVAEAGGHGVITASVSGTPEQLQADIRKCRQSTSGSFGVNLSIGICPHIEDMLEVCIEEKVPIETALYKPDALAKRIKQSGLPWIHKAARVKDAGHAAHLGADAVIVVGIEGGGFKNPAQLPTWTTIRHAVRTLPVPVIAAGGIGDAHGILGALVLGAEGVMMCSAFLTTEESAIGPEEKNLMLDLDLDDAEFRHRVMTPRIFNPKKKKKPSEKTNWAHTVSFAVAGIPRVQTVDELLGGMMDAAEKLLQERRFLID